MPDQSAGGQQSTGGTPRSSAQSNVGMTDMLKTLVESTRTGKDAWESWKSMVSKRERRNVEKLVKRRRQGDTKVDAGDIEDAINDAYDKAIDQHKQRSEELLNTLSSTLLKPISSVANKSLSEFGGQWGSVFSNTVGKMGSAVKGFISGNPAAGVASIFQAISGALEAFIKQIGENYRYLKEMQEESAKTAVMLGNSYANAKSAMGRLTGAGISMEIATGMSGKDLQQIITQAMSMGIISGETQAYGSQFGQDVAKSMGTDMTQLFAPRTASERFSTEELSLEEDVGISDSWWGEGRMILGSARSDEGTVSAASLMTRREELAAQRSALDDEGGVSLFERGFADALESYIGQIDVALDRVADTLGGSILSAEERERIDQQQEFFQRYFEQATGTSWSDLSGVQQTRLRGVAGNLEESMTSEEAMRDVAVDYATAAKWGQTQEMGLAEELQGLERAGYSRQGAMQQMQAYQKAGIVGVGNQSEFLLDLANIARTTGVAVEEFGQRAQGVAGTLAKFGTTQEEVIALSRRFSHELDVGRMSMGTLNNFISGMGISGMGSGGARAFIAEQALLQGESFTEGMGTDTASAVTDLMGELGGTNDPYQRQALMRYRMQQEGGTGRQAGIAMANQVLWQQTGQILGMSAEEAMQTEQGKATFLDTAQRMAPQLGVEVSDLIQEQEDLFDLSQEMRDYDEITADATQGMLQKQDELKGTVEDLYAETIQMHQDSKTLETQLNEAMRINTLSIATSIDALIMGTVQSDRLKQDAAERTAVMRATMVDQTMLGMAQRFNTLGEEGFSMSLGEKAIMNLAGTGYHGYEGMGEQYTSAYEDAAEFGGLQGKVAYQQEGEAGFVNFMVTQQEKLEEYLAIIASNTGSKNEEVEGGEPKYAGR